MMNENTVPQYVWELSEAKNERTVKRLIAVILALVVLLAASNALWLYAWMQYDYSSETESVVVDAAEGVANYIGNDGSIVNGKDCSNEKNKS